MKRKFLILLSAPFFCINLFSVFLTTCTCQNNGNKQCSWIKQATITVIDNADSLKHPPVNGQVLAKAMILSLSFVDSFTICKRYNRDFSIITKAYAAHKECIQYKSLDSITNIIVTSNKDFDAAHPAGTDLSGLFKQSKVYLNTLNGQDRELYLLNAPADTGTHIFTVTVHTADSTRTFTAQSDPIKLLL